MYLNSIYADSTNQQPVHYTLGTLEGLVRGNMFTSVRFLIIQLISLKLNSSFHRLAEFRVHFLNFRLITKIRSLTLDSWL